MIAMFGVGRRGQLAAALVVSAFLGIAPPAAAQPEVEGQWTNFVNLSSTAIHSHVLAPAPSDAQGRFRVLYWPAGSNPTVRMMLVHPTTGAISFASSRALSGYRIFCAGHALTPDGKLLVLGGGTSSDGLELASVYDPNANTWTRLPDMNAGRWYPTGTTLADGNMLVTSGKIDDPSGSNRIPQVWQPSQGTWRDLTGANLSVPNYPWMHVAPDGRVFLAGPTQGTRFLNPSANGGAGSWSSSRNRIFGQRSAGTSVMYAPGRVLVIGGGTPPVASAEVVDLNGSPTTPPPWRYTNPMAFPRRHHNATILADGKVLVTGGTAIAGDDPNGAVFPAEAWDPSTEAWTTLAGAGRYYGYHSTAVLLPDGRVLSAGGNGYSNGQVFSPPYLFWGPRPTITDAPSEVAYGEEFTVATPDPGAIASVTLIRMSSVTHSFNMDQRIVYPAFGPAGDGLGITAPADGNQAPPGDYMLFLIDTSGVPSVSRIIRIH